MFAHDVSQHLCSALYPDPRYSECRHLPPALERSLCRCLAFRRFGASAFALHCRAAYGDRAPVLLVPPFDPPPWLFGGAGAAALGPLMVVTSGPPGPALSRHMRDAPPQDTTSCSRRKTRVTPAHPAGSSC